MRTGIIYPKLHGLGLQPHALIHLQRLSRSVRRQATQHLFTRVVSDLREFSLEGAPPGLQRLPQQTQLQSKAPRPRSALCTTHGRTYRLLRIDPQPQADASDGVPKRKLERQPVMPMVHTRSGQHSLADSEAWLDEADAGDACGVHRLGPHGIRTLLLCFKFGNTAGTGRCPKRLPSTVQSVQHKPVQNHPWP